MQGPGAALLDLVIRTAPDAIVTIDEAGLILSFSPAAERMFGYSEEEAVGRDVAMLMPEPHRSRHGDYLRRYLSTGEKRVIGIGREVRACRRNGETFAAELAVGELHRDGAPVFTGFIRDIGDRVAAERRAAQMRRELDQASRIRMLGEMSTALAHEINQPLAAIANYAQAARRVLDGDAQGAARAEALLGHVADEARRAGEIMTRMRRMVERGRADLRPEDINDIVRDAARLAHLGAPEDGFEVVCDLAPDLPPVLADRIQIQQVVINLMRNAVEAMGGDRPGVRLATERAAGEVVIRATRADGDEDEVVVTVADTGPGVPPHLLETVFDPFVSGRETGIGIGLAVCRSIIDAHNGRIWAENAPDGGAAIHFTLPVAPSA